MMIKIVPSGGVAPGIDPAALPDGMAQIAEDCDFSYGDVRPLRDNTLLDETLSSGTQSILYYGGLWRGWKDVVDITKSPIVNSSGRTIVFGASVDGPIEFDYDSAGSNPEPSGWLLGIPAPDSAPSLTAGDGGDCDVADQTTVAILYTFVRTRAGVDQEGPPSSYASVDLCEGQTVTISGFDSPDSDYAVTHIRLYGAVSGTYYVIDTIPVTDTSYDFDYSSTGFGATELPSDGWDSAPTTAKGIIVTATGVGVCFDKNEVLLSVPNQLHAWPQAYRQPTEYEIASLIEVGDVVAVLTKGDPYFIIGVWDPATAQLRRIDSFQACVAKRSAVDMGGYGIYAGTEGLIAISQTGETRNLTEKWYTPDAWRELIYPSSIKAYNWRGRYVAFHFPVTGYTAMSCEDPMDSPFDSYTGTGKGFIYDPKINGLVELTSFADGGLTISETIQNGGVTQVQAGSLAIVDYGDVYGMADDSGAIINETYYKSKKFRLPKEKCFRCAQVIFDTSVETTVYFYVYADGVLKHTESITASEGSKPFRLPGGYRALEWEFVIESGVPVKYALVAETMKELATA